MADRGRPKMYDVKEMAREDCQRGSVTNSLRERLIQPQEGRHF